jgi:hypothetical protein
MPASNKMLKSRQHAANRAAGIGDEDGKLPARIKPANVNCRCTKCMQEIRMTKTNTEAKAHVESKHPTVSFAECFPGQFDPTVSTSVAAPTTTTSDSTTSSTSMMTASATSTETPAATAPKKTKKKEDLSFLDAAVTFDVNKVQNKKK